MVNLPAADMERVASVVRQYWGFDTLRPLQSEAIAAALAGRDSLTVLPTGGGKSLCYQVPPLVSAGTDVVVSPLISLMKDQVDGLRAIGYPAVAIYSGMTPEERRQAHALLRSGECRLAFAAPERLLTDGFLELLAGLNVGRFAIDEAHCISQWGHDFRPEYRALSRLRDYFPNASLHAYTATATPRVRHDIVEQLHLVDPAVMVGRFDRPNLVYRILPKVDLDEQVFEVLERHAGEAVIIYCLSRKDTESLTALLVANGITAAAYHAGLSPEQRRRAQEQFADEELNVVVATVAFGMGIDRSNVRCVLHATMPKTIENYQQETGRAGRDGLEAECVMLYSQADAIRWESLIERGIQNSSDFEAATAAADGQRALLKLMQRLCGTPRCRHRALSEYFGQEYDSPNCGACDVCLQETEGVEDATVTAQKILSCIYRTGQRFGAGHVVDVLVGADTEQVRSFGHETLSTYGLLKELPKKRVQSLVYQLVDLELVTRTPGDRPTLQLNDASWAVLRGQQQVQLIRPKEKIAAKTIRDELSWEGADRGLADRLRALRREIAKAASLPPYMIFEDSTLIGLARVRPTRRETLLAVRGIGEGRSEKYGEQLLAAIAEYCGEHGLTIDCLDEKQAARTSRVAVERAPRPNEAKQAAFEVFRRGVSVEAAMTASGRASSTVQQYLADYITAERPTSIAAWVDDATYERIATVAAGIEDRFLRPIFDQLDGQVPYETIRLVLAHLAATAGE